MIFFQRVVLFILAISLSQIGFAKVFQARFGKNTDLIVIDDAATDLRMRLALFKKAKKSIEIVSHIHTSGLMGMAISIGLHDALSEGVEVRYLYEKTATMFAKDFSDNVIAFLTDSELPRQAEIIAARPLEKVLSTPFSFSDFFHQKMIIIDRGTPNETIVIGGRNHDELSIRSADLSYVFRRINDGENSKEKSIMDDLLQHYDDTWSLAEKHFSKEAPRKLSKKQKLLLKTNKAAYLKLPITNEGQQILQTLETPPGPTDTLAPFQFRPEFFRLVTNDALKNIETQKSQGSPQPKGTVNDDITLYLSTFLERATKVELNSYILLMPKPITDSVKGVVARNGEAVVYTNNAKSYGRLVRFPGAGKIAEGYNHESIVELTRDAESSARLSVHMFDATLGAQAPLPIEYYHQKLAIIQVPNPRKTDNFNNDPLIYSWLTTYNFTISSALKNDEMGVMAQDNRLGSYLSYLNTQAAAKYHVRISPDESRRAVTKGKFLRNLCRKAFMNIL